MKSKLRHHGYRTSLTISALVIFLALHIFCPAGQGVLTAEGAKVAEGKVETKISVVKNGVLKGGCAKVNITPPLGIPLIGSYGKPSDDVLDELYARALVLSDGENTIAIVSADLLYTQLEEITNPVRQIIKEKADIPEENILVCATHTHSGPEVFTRSKVPREGRLPAFQIDQSYLETLIRKIASSVLIAYKHTQGDSGEAGTQVRIGAARGQIPEILYNRRPKNAEGMAKMAFTLPAEVTATRKINTGPGGDVMVTFTLPDEKEQLEFGLIDPEVRVLRVEDMNGQIVGSLVNFGCHPVCIYPSLSTSISADYPAYATQVVEQTEGGICLFALGLAGNTVPIQRGVTARGQIGKALGGEALRRLQLVATTGDVTLEGRKKEVRFPVKKAPSPDGVADDDKGKEYATSEIQVLRLDEIYILGLPGEILVEVGLQIKKRAGVENLFIITLSNDTIGYVCHSQAYEEGGYEPGSGTNLAKGAGEIMIEEAVGLINQIRQGQ
jgi:neutral ceramidase